MLTEKIDNAEADSKQAVEDSNILIMTEVGEDINLLLILFGLCSPDTKNVFFLKPGNFLQSSLCR